MFLLNNLLLNYNIMCIYFFWQMTAEFHVLSPVVPTRESYFVRYCKQLVDGSWAVVDVSLDSLRPNPLVRCRRRPSGCLIQELPNGYSQVTKKIYDSFHDTTTIRISAINRISLDDRNFEMNWDVMILNFRDLYVSNVLE